MPAASALAERASTCSSRPSASIVSSTASAAAQDTGLPPKVRAVLAGLRAASAASPKARQAPIGSPPPRPLARVIDVRARRPSAWWANQRAGAADAGLHLVEHQQRAVPRGDLARGRAGSRPAAATTPPSP